MRDIAWVIIVATIVLAIIVGGYIHFQVEVTYV